MLDGLRSRLAWNAALRAVRRRTSPTALRPLGQRCVLAVVPADAERDVWDALKQLDLPARQLRLVALGMTSPPDAFAGAVQVLDDRARDWRGLPIRLAADAWAFGPDVAINFARPADPAAMLVVGASPASVRVSGHDPRSEAAYDLLTADTGGDRPDPAVLLRTLELIDPPLVPLRELPVRGSRGLPPRV